MLSKTRSSGWEPRKRVSNYIDWDIGHLIQDILVTSLSINSLFSSFISTKVLGYAMHFNLMSSEIPGGQKHTTTPTTMFYILQIIDKIRDPTHECRKNKHAKGCCTAGGLLWLFIKSLLKGCYLLRSITNHSGSPCHCPVPTCRAISQLTSLCKARKGCWPLASHSSSQVWVSSLGLPEPG